MLKRRIERQEAEIMMRVTMTVERIWANR